MNIKTIIPAFLMVLASTTQPAEAQRKFIHPGLMYTQADLDRMKAMVDARQEPFYTTYQNLESTIVTPGTLTPITEIATGAFNNTIGMAGRRAHDNALMWHLTGKTSYAESAVKYLNQFKDLTSASSSSTAPLDNGKIFLLLEAAELMRNYEGWAAADQQDFKDMLVYPGYSTTETPTGNVSFYWNIYNFDRNRFGNQGLFAAHALMAMAIYLDNEIMYDRAYRYLMSLPHRSDDLPYPSGPVERLSISEETDYMISYNNSWLDTEEDYISDEALQYYIYQNGQCEESCRDQGHVFAGLNNYVYIAELAWNQGDTLYSELDNRILLGLEYSNRYNLTGTRTYDDQTEPWEPTGYSLKESACTYDNGKFYRAYTRSGRWFGKKIYDGDRGNMYGPSGTRQQAFSHYSVRAGLDSEKTKWSERALDLLMEDYGFENWGTSGHHYEFLGWGTLTKRLNNWMAGDPGTFTNGERISGYHSIPCTINATDYDFYSGNGEGHTYHNVGTDKSQLYRTDGTIEIISDDEGYAITDMVSGEWMNYSVIFPAPEGNTTAGLSEKYNIYVTYKASADGAKLFAAVGSDDNRKGKDLAATNEWTEKCLGTFDVEYGATVVRIYVKGNSNLLQLKNIRIQAVEGKALQPVDWSSATVAIYDADNNDVTADYSSATTALTDGDKSNSVDLASNHYLVYDFGTTGTDISSLTLYNNGSTQNTNETVMVFGATTKGAFKVKWNRKNASNLFSTSGTTYSIDVDITDDSWITSDGSIGSISIDSIGKYRYIAFYNSTANFNASEVIAYSTNTVNVVDIDTEEQAVWDDDSETAISNIAIDSDIFKPIINGNTISIAEAEKIEAYSITGVKKAATASNQITLPNGMYLLKATANGNTKVIKVAL